LVSGDQIDVPALLSAQRPKDRAEKVAMIVRTQRADKNLAQGLANRLLHPPLPTKDLIHAIATAENSATLSSHAISRDAQAALRNGDVNRFLEIRKAALQNTIDRYFARQADWGADDSPSLESMTMD
jgi:hypothetical protein